MEDIWGTVQDHEKRIKTLEVNEAVTANKLDITNGLLKAIALMIGGGMVSLLFNILYHTIKF